MAIVSTYSKWEYICLGPKNKIAVCDLVSQPAILDTTCSDEYHPKHRELAVHTVQNAHRFVMATCRTKVSHQQSRHMCKTDPNAPDDNQCSV